MGGKGEAGASRDTAKDAAPTRKGRGEGRDESLAMRCTAEIRQDNAEEIGYCQPDGRHSADPRVPFALPATSKPSREPSSFYILRSISRLGSHPRVLSTGILDSRKYFKPTPRYSSPLLFTFL